ncbi:MAG: hypothetical protein H0Z24_10315 [Thermosipho sp. (in: Bacteria)]|nr:hypothetical protein [Thermosipho sp. (in: thermotogales)]
MSVILNNCFLLLLPIFIWNLVFAHKLIEIKYPISIIKLGKLEWLENILRAIIFVFPIFMKFNVSNINFSKYFTLYIIGIVIYFTSWLLLIYFPDNYWSTNKIGLLAPAYTTIIWLVAIGLLGNSKVYSYLSVVFTIVHTFSSYLKLKIANKNN